MSQLSGTSTSASKNDVGATVLITNSVLLLLVSVLNIVVGPGYHSFFSVAAIFASIVGLYSGLRWRRNIKHRKAQTLIEQSDYTVLSAAARHHGRLTQAQLIVASELNAQEANDALENLVKQSLAFPEVLPSGVVEYNFPGLTQSQQDITAEGQASPLD